MKKLMSILICAMLSFTLIACTGGGTGSSSNSGGTGNTSDTSSGSGNSTGNSEYVFKEREIKEVGQFYKGTDVVYPDSLWQTPDYEYCTDLDFGGEDTEGVKGLFYTSPIKNNGKPTKIAAYIGFPKGASKDNKVSAIVLVHGGLGTAVPQWVKYWNDQGFAAISMDTEGAEPINGVSNYNCVHIERNRYDNDENFSAGPTNLGFSDYQKPLEEQWYYHATSAVIVATSLIRSFDCVDPQKVGITGISWGGMITSVVTGYDDRLTFSIPVYGSVSLKDSCSGFATIYGNDEVAARWDTSEALKQRKVMMFAVNGIRDDAFSFDATSRTAKAAGGFCLFKYSFHHGQYEGALEEDLPYFARYACGMESSFLEILHNPTREDPTLSFRTYGDVVLNSIKIYYTDNEKPNKNAVWESKAVKLIDNCKEYSVNIPQSTYAYINIKYNNALEVSSYLF